ncbi:MAG: universal stress protein, partial [Anaerolineales bacterium]
SGSAHVALGGQLARLAHARVTILGYGLRAESLQQHLQEAKEKLGSGLASLDIRTTPDSLATAVALESERQPYDLVVLDFPPEEGVTLAKQALQSGDHHVLLAPRATVAQTPTRALICVTGGEPGKQDVLFAGRLVRHLGAEATLLSVIPGAKSDPGLRARAERFLASGVRTLDLLGVPAKTVIGSGPVHDEIIQQMQAGGHDLLVLGAPLADRDGRVSLSGVVGQVLNEATGYPVLIVRSHYPASPAPQLRLAGRINIVEEIIP